MLVTGTANISISNVTAAPITAKRHRLAPITSPASWLLPSPIFLPSRMVVPIASPTIAVVTVCITQLPVETADMSAAEPNQPTISISTAPYIVWRKIASRTGSAKSISGESIFPSVKFCVDLISDFLSFLRSSLKEKPDKKQVFQPAILSGLSFLMNGLPPMNAIYLSSRK